METYNKLKSWLIANKYDVNKYSLLMLIKYFLFYNNARAIILLYIVSSPNKNRWKRLLAKFLLRNIYHIECSTTVIGYGLMMPHPFNIIIAAQSLGDNVQINQNVTIGGNMKKYKDRDNGLVQKLPIIGNNVVIYTNAVVGGPIIIHDNVIIGANCVCTHDVESNTLLYNQCQYSKRKIEVGSGTYKII